MSAFVIRERDKRALMLGGLITIPALAYVFLLAPLGRAIGERHATMTQEREALERDRALLQRAPQLQTQLGTMTDWLGGEARRLFQGTDDVAATSGLADYVNDASDLAGVRVRQTETRPAITVTNGVRAVRLDVRAEGSMTQILGFLDRLEHGKKLVRIGRIAVSHVAAPTVPGAPSAPGASVPARPGMPTGMPSGVTLTSVQPNTARSNEPSRVLSLTVEVYGYAPSVDGTKSASAEALQTAPSKGAAYQPLRANGSVGGTPDAIARDPFRPDYGPPPPTPVVPKPKPPFPVQLVGTVVSPTQTFAMCQVGTSAPIAVREGQTVAGYTLRSIERGRIVLADQNGQETHLNIPTPGT